MIINKEYPTNYAWAGTNAIMYNVAYDQFLVDKTLNLKNEYKNQITGFGFEYRKTNDTVWTIVPLMPTADEMTAQGLDPNLNENKYFQGSSSVFGDSKLAGNAAKWNFQRAYRYYEKVRSWLNKDYVCQQYAPVDYFWLKNGFKPYPIRVLIPGLELNTSYTVRSYYYLGENNKQKYNEVVVSTNGTLKNVTLNFQLIAAYPGTTLEETNSFRSSLSTCSSKLSEIIQMFMKNEAFSGIRFWSNNPLTAEIGIYYSLGDTGFGYCEANKIYLNAAHNLLASPDQLLSYVTSLCMNFFAADNDDNYHDAIVKFMEFATFAPYATWNWIDLLNYPLNNGMSFSYLDNCLLIAAAALSRSGG